MGLIDVSSHNSHVMLRGRQNVIVNRHSVLLDHTVVLFRANLRLQLLLHDNERYQKYVVTIYYLTPSNISLHHTGEGGGGGGGVTCKLSLHHTGEGGLHVDYHYTVLETGGGGVHGDYHYTILERGGYMETITTPYRRRGGGCLHVDYHYTILERGWVVHGDYHYTIPERGVTCRLSLHRT